MIAVIHAAVIGREERCLERKFGEEYLSYSDGCGRGSNAAKLSGHDPPTDRPLRMLIVSLTTIPPRFPLLEPTLKSLLAQTAPIDRIILYLPTAYRRFADWDGTLPIVPTGVEIRHVDQDYGPATKVLPAACEFRGQDCDILFCDDDRFYQPGWAQHFLTAKAHHPGCCITLTGLEAHWLSPGSDARALQPRAVRRWRSTDWRFKLDRLRQRIREKRWNLEGRPSPARRVFKNSGYIDVFEGQGGVLVRPEYFDDDAFRIPPVTWAVDDVWLSGSVARRGIPIWLVGNVLEPAETDAELICALFGETIDGADRHAANAATVDYMRREYGIWL